MKNKIFAAAMTCVAIAVMFLVPVGLGNIDTEKGDGRSDSGVSTSTASDAKTTAFSSDGNGQQTVPSQSEGATTTVPQSEDVPKVTTVVTENSGGETKPTVTTTVKKTDAEMTVGTSETEGSKASTAKVTATSQKVTTTKKKTTTTKVTTTTKKTTTTSKKPVNVNTNAPKGTPVQQHGQLSVKGANIVDSNGKVFQLRGMSTHGVGWFPDAVTKQNFKVLRDDWGCNAVRLAMYIEESGGGSESCYLQDKNRNLQLVKNGIDYCIDLGMYVIVDWHVLNPGDPTTHTAEAQAFFETIAKEYGDCPNIIYELVNEPNGGVTWSGKIKPYCEKVIKSVRKYDSDAVVVCGTGTWSQDIHDVIGNTMSDKNVVYALHFYANTHTDWLRQRVKDCYNKGLPILVTEFGSCDASGNGGFNASQTKKWLTHLDSMNIGYFNWSLCNKGESASAMNSWERLDGLKAGESQLTESGKLIRSEYRKRAGF